MKKWQKEHEDFLKENPVKSNQLKNLFIAFCLFFPNFTTYNGFKNRRCDLGIVSRIVPKESYRRKPLLSENVKKGFVRVKIAEHKWVQKQKWLWECHYGIRVPKGWNVLFLDGNNRNFDINNIYPLPLELCGLFLGHTSGVIKGNRQATLLNIQIARTMHAMFNFAKKMDLVSPSGSLRYEVARRAYNARKKRLASMSESEREEKRQKTLMQHREYYQRLKTENPEEYERRKLVQKEYKKQWIKNRRKRQDDKNQN